jgi:hypothetical protein
MTSVAGGIMSMKNSNDTIGNRTRYIPVFSAVPQPTAPTRVTALDRILSHKNSGFISYFSLPNGTVKEI